MSSTEEERSLASGIPIPQWMRSKTDNYGFDPSTLSPPTNESDIFYIKFPAKKEPEPSKYKSLAEVIKVKEKAFIKHTESCKQFIPKIQDTVQIKKPKVLKPMGVDDGFKGEGAACGASVVEVAHQILSGKGKPLKPFQRGDTEGSLGSTAHSRQRRDSISLPASPITSPESSPLSKRKNIPTNSQSRLFETAFLQNKTNLTQSEEHIDKKSGSWILSSLFASRDKRDTKKESDSSMVILEDDSKKVMKQGDENNGSDTNLKKESVSMTVEIKTLSPTSDSPKGYLFKSKPHLRDLNMLTPSSM